MARFTIAPNADFSNEHCLENVQADGRVGEIVSPDIASWTQICADAFIPTGTVYWVKSVEYIFDGTSWWMYANGAWSATTDPRIGLSVGGASAKTAPPPFWWKDPDGLP